jgi:UDP-3-O-[3-hydroxymyristoyl] glucosamine N-acyltransferase
MLECPPIDRPITSKGAVIIGDKVWLGDKVTILSGVTIGDQAIVGLMLSSRRMFHPGPSLLEIRQESSKYWKTNNSIG